MLARFGAAIVVLASANLARAADLEFLERFALAEDRGAVLKELVPGTEDYYYFHSLHAQHEGRLDEVDTFLEAWVDQHGETGQVMEIRNRQALLRYGADPESTLAYLKERLGLYFDQEAQIPGVDADLPSALDMDLIRRETLLKRVLNNPGYADTIQGFTTHAYDWLIARDLDPLRLRSLLEHLQLPDYPNLATLIARDLDAPNSGGFGSLAIHHNLVQGQLDELLRLKPELIHNEAFITATIRRLRPSNDLMNWRLDPKARGAYLERLEGFTDRLAPAHNTLKAHVLYHRLQNDMGQGVYDRARFLEYLAVPRQVDYVRREFLDRLERGARVADLNYDNAPATGLAPVGSDEALVRAYLTHFFLAGDSIEPFKAYVREDYLRRLYAETMLLHGEGELERWYAWLDAGTVEALTERVDVEFAPENPERFAPDAPVSLTLWVKNVDMLIVKVFEIDEANYYRQFQRAVKTDIDLDGVVSNHEEVFHYDEPPLRRVSRTLEFPQLDGRGVWVIECIGNGRSSRAVVEKGQLHFMSRTGPAGQTLTVFDERGTKLSDASVWFSGRTYVADDFDEIVLPFSTAPSEKRVVLMHGDFASLDTLHHEGESYALHAGFHVDRESLRVNRTASAGIRPYLTLNGTRVPLRLVTSPVLTIVAQTHDGISSTEQIRDVTLSDDDLLVHDFQVPENLARLHFTLTATVDSLTGDEPVELSASTSLDVNGIDTTQQMAVWFLLKSGEDYALELRDKTGLPLPGRRASLRMHHVDFVDPVHAELKTDAEGRILLGALTHIASLAVSADGMIEQDWQLDESYYAYPAAVQGSTAAPLRIPYVGPAPEASVQPLWLLEVRDGAYVADRSASLRVDGGYIIIHDVPAGDYVLDIKPVQRRISIRVTDGDMGPYYVASDERLLDATTDTAPQIQSVTPDDGVVTIAIGGADDATRVHVTATRFVPEDSAGSGIDAGTEAGLSAKPVRGGHAFYQSGRDIGDEYRYILERRFATKYPGNMLDRPSLLLNPWARKETQAAQDDSGAAEPPSAAAPPALARESELTPEAPKEASAPAPVISPRFDFLDGDAVTMFNLPVDDQGKVSIPRAELDGRHHLHIVVTDRESAVARSVALDIQDVPYRDLRLASSIDPEAHAVEQKQIRVLGSGERVEVNRSSEARVQVYDSIPRVYSLFTTLNAEAKLREFSFAARWPQLSREDKLAHFSKYTSHELNFFLYHKDRAFFDEFVRPYLEHKYAKQFMDAWLLGGDLTAYLEPWRYAQLNAVERILLAQRIDEERERTLGAIRDSVELIPPDPQGFNARFMTALYGGSLSGQGTRLAEEVALGISDFSMDSPAGNGGFDARGGGGGFGGGGVTDRSLGYHFNGAWVDNAPVAGAALHDMVRQYSTDGDGVQEFYGADMIESRTRLDFKRERAEEQLGRRAAYRALYQSPEATREWVENYYFELPLEQQHAGLIAPNAFWLDYAEQGEDVPFLSSHVAEATRNFPEMMLALAVLDLPFEAEEHGTEQGEAAFALRAGSPLVAFFKDIQSVTGLDAETPVLVSQNFFRVDDRYRFEGNERFDRFVRDEFLTRVVYGCQITVTNPTSTPHEIDVLRQIPQGALPVNSGRYTRSERMRLEPYSTATMEYYFYFPRPGDFEHYPVHVSEDGALLAHAEPESMHVVDVPSSVDRSSWQYVSQQGSADEVFAFLRNENLYRVDLSAIAWRLRDRAFFEQVVEVLNARRMFDAVVWGFAVYHNVPEAISTLLQFRDDFVASTGPWLASPLLTIDAEARRAYEHIEYAPLINPRAHHLNARWTITNDQLREHYARLMAMLAHKPALEADDLMALTYYMLLQDRVEEALEYFGKVPAAQLAARVQYDYFDAYLAMYREAPEAALTIASKYADYPVERWRKLFADVRSHVAEISGAAEDAAGERLGQDRLAATEPRLEFDVEDEAIVIHHQHLASASIGFFPIDVEMLFTRNPFDPAESGVFAGVEPALVETVKFEEGATVTEVGLPEAFANRHVVIQIESAGLRRSEVRYASTMVVQAIERYGQVQVRDEVSERPLSKVYVKVFARMGGGGVVFYKDGYTDLRGRFDYASSSTLNVGDVQEFAVLVLGEDAGAEVLTVEPPAR